MVVDHIKTSQNQKIYSVHNENMVAHSTSTPSTPPKGQQEEQENNNNDESNKVERIYIGGIDPSKDLKPSHLIKRLRQIQSIDILSIDDGNDDDDVNRDRTYLFLNATIGKKDDRGDSLSALDVIASQYNNVMWKGCKLRVERAKLHFLERLKLERLHRQQQQQQQLQENETTTTNDDKDATPIQANNNKNNIPRHLRIKRKHGEEALFIDTKPRNVPNVTQFDKMVHLMNQRRTKHSEKQILEEKKKNKKKKGKETISRTGKDQREESMKMKQTKAHLNRAVHVRFVGDGETEEVIQKRRTRVDVEELQEGGEESDDITTSESDIEEEEKDEQETNGKKSVAYIWSDDDDDNDEANDKNDKKEKKNSSKISSSKTSNVIKHDDDDDDASSTTTSDDDDKAEEMSNNNDNQKTKEHTPPSNNEKKKNKAYVWSDDDDDYSSSDDESAVGNASPGKHSKYTWNTTKKAMTDEFSGGFDFDTIPNKDDILDHNVSNNDYYNDDDDDKEEEDLNDINVDVQTNLDILSQFFPEMKHVEPAWTMEEKGGEGDGSGSNAKNGDDAAVAGQSTTSVASASGGGMGFMQRYDPTKESSKRYEVVTPALEKEDGVDDDANKKDKKDDELEQEESGSEKKSDLVDEEESVSTSDSDDDDDEEEESLSSSADGKEDDSDANQKNEITTKDDQQQQQRKNSTQLYEQKKLEDIFRDAREGNSDRNGGGGMTFGFQFDNTKSSQNERKFEDGGGVVYEEKKLENIFRQAREGGGGEGVDAAGGGGGGGMSFGFQFDLPSKDGGGGGVEKEASGGNVGTEKKGGEKQGGLEKEEIKWNTKDANHIHEDHPQDKNDYAFASAISEEEPLFEIKRRDGMRLPESLLDDLESAFFSFHGGDKLLLKDIEAMKHDEEEQKAWNEERRILTADWKRKHKYACSQKQKKMKYR